MDSDVCPSVDKCDDHYLPIDNCCKVKLRSGIVQRPNEKRKTNKPQLLNDDASVNYLFVFDFDDEFFCRFDTNIETKTKIFVAVEMKYAIELLVYNSLCSWQLDKAQERKKCLTACVLWCIKIKRQRIRWAVITCLCNTLIATHCFSLYDRTWTELNKWVRFCWLLLLQSSCYSISTSDIPLQQMDFRLSTIFHRTIFFFCCVFCFQFFFRWFFSITMEMGSAGYVCAAYK